MTKNIRFPYKCRTSYPHCRTSSTSAASERAPALGVTPHTPHWDSSNCSHLADAIAALRPSINAFSFQWLSTFNSAIRTIIVQCSPGHMNINISPCERSHLWSHYTSSSQSDLVDHFLHLYANYLAVWRFRDVFKMFHSLMSINSSFSEVLRNLLCHMPWYTSTNVCWEALALMDACSINNRTPAHIVIPLIEIPRLQFHLQING